MDYILIPSLQSLSASMFGSLQILKFAWIWSQVSVPGILWVSQSVLPHAGYPGQPQPAVAV